MNTLLVRNILAGCLFVVLAFYLTLGTNSEYLRKLQELDFFAFTGSFWQETLSRAGGFTVMAAGFCNQFFYHPWMGMLLYSGILFLTGYLTSKVFHLGKHLFPLILIPPVLLLLTLTQPGYMIYVFKINGYVFVPLLGYLFVLLTAWTDRNPTARKSLLIQAGYTLLLYPVCGVYSVFAGLLAILRRLQLKAYMQAGILAGTTLLIPVLYCRFVFHDVNWLNQFWVLLPDFALNKTEGVLWIPYLLLAAFTLIISWFRLKNDVTVYSKIVFPAFFTGSLLILFFFSFRDTNFKTELAMQEATSQQDWEKVLKIAQRQTGEPSRLIVMHTTLALYKTGQAGDRLYAYQDGNKPLNSPRAILPVQIAGRSIYYEYGLLNYSYRWCIEDMVEYGVSFSNLKSLVRCTLLNGEYKLAAKYNNILSHTLFYRKWAEHYQQFIDHPERIAEVAEFAGILKLNAFGNMLDGDNSMLEPYIRNFFAFMEGGTPEMVELSLLFNMDMKSIPRFWPRYFLWAGTHAQIPRHMQEAALLFEYLEQKNNLDTRSFDPALMERFKQFIDFSQQYAGYPEEQVQKLYEDRFAGTYWYYYFFVKNHRSENSEKTELSPFSS